VLDTNVVVSALLFGGGVMGQLRTAWQRGACVPLTSTVTAQELLRVLAYPKFRLDAHERDELLADYLPYARVMRVPEKIAPFRCRDPFDIPFLQLALAGKADALVSGDRDLRALSGKFVVPILTPAQFIDSCR
jgi:putative PIN family toxin of toxin-antitoxin system